MALTFAGAGAGSGAGATAGGAAPTPEAAARDAADGDRRAGTAGVGATVRAARAGDRVAFGELYHHYAAMVHGILLARLPPREVGDVLQEVFLRALRSIGSLRDEAAFGGWLATLARTAAADRWRYRPPAAQWGRPP